MTVERDVKLYSLTHWLPVRQDNYQDRYFNVLRSTPSLSSVSSGTHHVQRSTTATGWRCLRSTSRAAIVQRAVCTDNLATKPFQSVAHHLEQYVG